MCSSLSKLIFKKHFDSILLFKFPWKHKNLDLPLNELTLFFMTVHFTYFTYRTVYIFDCDDGEFNQGNYDSNSKSEQKNRDIVFIHEIFNEIIFVFDSFGLLQNDV